MFTSPRLEAAWQRSLGVARRKTDMGWALCTLVLSLGTLRGSAATGLATSAPHAALVEALAFVVLTAAVLLFAQCCPERYYRVRQGLLSCIRLVRTTYLVTRVGPRVVASTLPVGCAAHFVALASPSLLLMVRSYGFQLRLDAHLATQLAALLAMMPACTHKCRAELTRPGAADLFVRTASAVGRGLHASRAFLLPLFVGATSLPQPPSGPSTPLSACIALQWMQLLVLGFGLPTLLLFRVEASSRRLLLKSLLHSNEPGLRDEARKEVARGWALPEPPPPRTSAAATAGLRPGGARLQALRIRTASALPYAAVVVLAWQGGSVAWALCVAAADAWVAVAGG